MYVDLKQAARSNYGYWIDSDGDVPVLVIEDYNSGGMSVTNNIENILARIAFEKGFGDGKSISGVFDMPIVYKDSDGYWDGVTVGDNNSVSFFCLNSDTLPEAMNRIRNHGKY